MKTTKSAIDGKLLVSSSVTDKCVKIWNVGSFYRCDRKIETADEQINCIAISPDNQFVLAGTASTLYIWNIKTGELVRCYGHEAIIDAIDVDPIPYKEKTWIIHSGCPDGIIRRFVFHDNGIRYQLKREDFSTVFRGNAMDISRTQGLTEDTCLFLRQSGARGEPNVAQILAEENVRTSKVSI